MSFFKQAQVCAVAIKVGERYFCGFGEKKQVLTAWSLAGAQLFMSSHQDDAKAVMKKLDEKKKKYEVVIIEVAACQ